MTMKRWDGGSWNTDLTTRKRWDGASWVDLTVARRWDGASWVDIAFPGGGGGSFSATISDGNPYGDVFDPMPAPLFKPVTSSSTTVTPSGGTGPYTYSWSRISGDSAVSADSPTAATTTFSANVPREGFRTAVYRCTITDSLAATTFVDATVLLEYTSNL